jgi:hypothetical protein
MAATMEAKSSSSSTSDAASRATGSGIGIKRFVQGEDRRQGILLPEFPTNTWLRIVRFE